MTKSVRNSKSVGTPARTERTAPPHKRLPAALKAPQTGSATKTEVQMVDRLATLQPGTRRYDVLECAIRFKRSWIELAEHLTQVQQRGEFKEWGYRTFEAYAQHELHLRRETVQKLVRSYDFLSSHEPDVLGQRREEAPLPSYQALDILAEARQNPYLAEDDYRQIRDQVFQEDLPPNAVKKLVKERAPEPPKAVEDDKEGRLRKCLAMAERLYGMLLEEDVPTNIAQSVETAVGGLRRLLEE